MKARGAGVPDWEYQATSLCQFRHHLPHPSHLVHVQPRPEKLHREAGEADLPAPQRPEVQDATASDEKAGRRSQGAQDEEVQEHHLAQLQLEE